MLGIICHICLNEDLLAYSAHKFARTRATLTMPTFEGVNHYKVSKMLGGDDCKRPDGVPGADPANRGGGTKLCVDCSDEMTDLS